MAEVLTAVVTFDLDSLSTGAFKGTVTITAETPAVDANGALWMPASLVYDLSTATESDPLLASDGSTPELLYTVVIEGGNAAPIVLVHRSLLSSASPVALSSLIVSP
jgi:hypothetical protein